jgi:hypothetical protein
MSIESKYDLKRLHADCLAWCENPQWKPWMKVAGLRVVDTGLNLEIHNPDDTFRMVLYKGGGLDIQTMNFAHFIGIDIESYRFPKMTHKEAVESYRFPKMTHKEAVERYLASVPEGGELIPGWVMKTTRDEITALAMGRVGEVVLYEFSKKADYKLPYYFLRLDLKEGYEVEVQP